MLNGRYDVVIIGSGAGGGTLAHALADTGAEILLLERGDYVPQEPENWDPEAVWKHRRYRADETWLGPDGKPLPHDALERMADAMAFRGPDGGGAGPAGG